MKFASTVVDGWMKNELWYILKNVSTLYAAIKIMSSALHSYIADGLRISKYGTIFKMFFRFLTMALIIEM